MKSIGKSMSMSLTAPIVGLGGLAVKAFADFEQSMAKVKAISGATGEDFAALTQTAKDLGISTRFAASEVSELMLNYSKLGFSSDEIQKITGATLDLALATGEDLARSAEVAGSTLRAFGLDATDMVHLTDVMANSFSSSALDLDSFAESMKYVAPISKAAGVSVEETSAMLSVLANNGIKGSQAGTALKKIISEIGASGKPTNVALKELAATGLNLADASDEVGDRAKAALLILADGSAQIDPLTKAYKTQTNVAKDMAAIMDDTLEGSMMKLKSATEGLGISFGEVMAPAVGAAADVLASIAMKFSNLSEGAKTTIVVIAALVAAIGPLVFIIGAVMAVMSPLNLIIAGVVLVVAGLTAAIVYVVRNWDALTERFSDVGWWRNAIIDMAAFFIRYNPFSLFIKGINFLINLWQNTDWFIKGLQMMGQAFLKYNPISLLIKSINKVAEYMGKELVKPVVGIQKEIEKSGAITNPFEKMAKGLEGLKVETKGYTKHVETLGEAFDSVKEKVGKLTDTETPTTPKTPKTGAGEKDLTEKQQKKGLGKLKQELFEVKSGLKKINDTPILPVVDVEGIKTSLENVGKEGVHIFEQMGREMGAALTTGLKDLATEGLSKLGTFIGDSLTSNTMMNDQLENTKEHYNKLIEAARKNGDDITKLEEEKQAKVAEIQDSFSFGNRMQDFGRGLLESIGKFMGQFGEAMIAMGIAQTLLDVSIKSGNGPAAIIGGIALVAAGAAISNLSKKGVDKGGSVPDTGGGGGGGGGFNNQNGSPGYMMQMETKVSGRDIILVQEREKAFKR